MNRRTFLSLATSSMVIANGGCLSEGSTSRNPARTRTVPQSSPGKPTSEAPYPPYTDVHTGIDRVIGYEAVDPDTAPLYLEPSVQSRTLPDATYTFTLHNQGDRAFRTNFYSWSIHRWEAGEWWYVSPTGVKKPLASLSPGDSYTWHLTVTNEGIDRPTIGTGGGEELTVRGLGGGTYAFGIDGWWNDEDERTLVAAARFTIDAEQLSLGPSTAVTRATRLNETVSVEADRNYDTESYPAVFVLERTTNAENAVENITEGVIRSWPLRDALAYAVPEVRNVRVTAPTIATPPFEVQAEWPAVTYDGGTFRVSAHERGQRTTSG